MAEWHKIYIHAKNHWNFDFLSFNPDRKVSNKSLKDGPTWCYLLNRREQSYTIVIPTACNWKMVCKHFSHSPNCHFNCLCEIVKYISTAFVCGQFYEI